MAFIYDGLLIIVCIFDILILIKGISIYKSKNDNRTFKIIKLSKEVLIGGIIMLLLALLMCIVGICTNLDKNIILIVCMCSFLGNAFIFVYQNWKVTYDRKGFVFRNFLGKQYKYHYKEITAISATKEFIIEVGKRKFVLDCEDIKDVIAVEMFIHYAMERYEEYYGVEIPKKVLSYDVFRGNLNYPRKYITYYAIIYISILIAIIATIVNYIPKTSKQLVYTNIVVSDYEIFQEDLNLYTNESELMYKIENYKDVLSDSEQFITMCSNGNAYEVGTIFYSIKGLEYYKIYTIKTADEHMILTLEQVNQQEIKEGILWCVFWIVIMLICTIVIGIAIYIGRNPRKVHPRLVHLFFAKEDLANQEGEIE